VLAFGVAATPACETLGKPDGSPGCPTFLAGVRQGRIASDEIKEASGIAASHRNPGVYYLNNDSGDRARIFAIDERGDDLGDFYLEGAAAIDWEDMAVGPARDLPGTYIYVADIGDNRHRRDSVVIYRVPEPEVSVAQARGRFNLPGVVALRFRYPDGVANNAEALLIDPQTADLYIVTKVKNGPAEIFRYAAPHRRDEIAVLERVGSLELGDPLVLGSERVTGGDISIDGNQILLRTYTGVLIWLRSEGESIAQAFSRPPCPAPQRREPQGEGIAWKFDGSGYITISENEHQPVYFFARPPP
jgi:hypothetical protein